MVQSFYNTDVLLQSIENVKLTSSFLRNRYFPTDDSSVFASGDVLVEYKDGSRKMAPFVHPRKNGVTMERDGYKTKRYTPAEVKPIRVLTIDDLKKKGFGEALYANLPPEEREVKLLAKDIKELDESISLTEEFMAAQTLLTSGCIMKHLVDDKENPEEMEIRFYDEEANPNIYTPGKVWSDPTADIPGDLGAILDLFLSKGLPFSDLLVASDVAVAMMNNEKIQKLLDVRRFELGTVQPVELAPGVSLIMKLNIKGREISVFNYAEQYENEEGALTPYIPNGSIVATAPGAGKSVYGAVTQMEQSDEQFHTYPGKRVPKFLADANNNVRTIRLASRPLLIPNNKGAWISAKVI